MKKTAFIVEISCAFIIIVMLSFCNWTAVANNNQECQWVTVDQNSFSEILTMIGGRVRENYHKINTWQGKIKIVTDNVDEGAIAEKMFRKRLRNDGLGIPNKIKEHREFIREFALNVNRGSLYENYYTYGQNYFKDANTNRELQLNEQSRWGSGKRIITPDYYIDCIDITKPGGQLIRRDVIKQAHQVEITSGSHLIEIPCGSHLLPIYDPRQSLRVFGNPLWETFAKYLAYIDKHGQSSTLAGYTMKVTVEECNVGNVKKYKIVLPGVSSGGPKIYLSTTLVCSSEAGFNVVSCVDTANYDSVLEKKTWDYGLINGVYLPLQTTHVCFDKQTGNLDTQSTWTFLYQKVNQPVNNETFTYKNLDLKDSDKFVDKILNKEYTYQEGKLTEISQVGENNKAEEKPKAAEK